MTLDIPTLTIIISAFLAWIVTLGVSFGLKKDQPGLAKIRALLPALATVLAILAVGVDQHLEGVEALTWETLKGGVIAGGLAVLAHSQGKEALKLLAEQIPTAPPSQTLMMMGVLIWMGVGVGCSTAPQTQGPGLQLQLLEGECGPEWHGETTATATHPALWPEGAKQETTTEVRTRIYSDCEKVGEEAVKIEEEHPSVAD